MMSKRDAEELALFTARPLGAQVMRGERLDVGDLEIETTLRELKDQEVLFIVAPLDHGPQVRTTCSLCSTPHRGGECPGCKAEREEAKRVVEERLLFDEDFSALLREG